MNIFLDTNVLHQEGLYSRGMQVLLRMRKGGGCSIKIPELVKREFISKVEVDSLNNIGAARKSLGDYKKKFERGSNVVEEIEKIEKMMQDAEVHATKNINNSFRLWCQKHEIEILKFDESIMSMVIDDYFSGSGAFRSVKKRDDIPDSMIGYCIVEFMKKNKNVVVVVKDAAFKEYLSKLDGLKIFDSIASLLEDPDSKSLIEKLDATEKDIEKIKGKLGDADLHKRFEKVILTCDDVFSSIYITEQAISGAENLGIPFFGVSINGVFELLAESFEFGRVDYITPGNFSIEVIVKAPANVVYCSEYYNYLSLTEKRKSEVTMDSMEGGGICDLSEQRIVKVTGFMDIYFEESIKVDELVTDLKYFGDPDSPIKFSLNFFEAEIF